MYVLYVHMYPVPPRPPIRSAQNLSLFPPPRDYFIGLPFFFHFAFPEKITFGRAPHPSPASYVTVRGLAINPIHFVVIN